MSFQSPWRIALKAPIPGPLGPQLLGKCHRKARALASIGWPRSSGTKLTPSMPVRFSGPAGLAGTGVVGNRGGARRPASSRIVGKKSSMMTGGKGVRLEHCRKMAQITAPRPVGGSGKDGTTAKARTTIGTDRYRSAVKKANHDRFKSCPELLPRESWTVQPLAFTVGA